MAQIAREVGVSKGTLYNYFDGKAELFAAWVAGECERNLAHVFDIADPDGDPYTGLHEIGERMLRMMISSAGLTIYRMAIAEVSKFPELARFFYESGPARATTYMASWLRDQVAAGQLDIADPVFAAEQFFALCQSRLGMLIKLGLLTHPDDALIEKTVRGAVTIFLNTYGAKA